MWLFQLVWGRMGRLLRPAQLSLNLESLESLVVWKREPPCAAAARAHARRRGQNHACLLSLTTRCLVPSAARRAERCSGFTRRAPPRVAFAPWLPPLPLLPRLL